MNEHKDLKVFLNEALTANNLDCEKLSLASGIPLHFVEALKDLDIAKLPAAPYVRGYIKKISEILRINPDELWHLYKEELTHKTSGIHDKLPGNRFAIRHLNKKLVISIVVLILIIIYLIFNYKNLIGQVSLEIDNPNETLMAVASSQFNLSGKINPMDKLIINGSETMTDPSGKFESLYDLQPGINTIEFKVKKILGQEKIVVRQIIYQPQATTTQK